MENSITAEFLNAMHDAGMVPVNHTITADGTIHRFRVDGDKSGTLNGWYVLYSDGVPAGEFGSWKNGASHTWCQRRQESMSDAERAELTARLEQARAERAKAKAAAQEAAAAESEKVWSEAKPAGDHDYLKSKQVKAYGLRQVGRALLVPMRNTAGDLRSLQRIMPDGVKRFQLEGQVQGLYHAIGKPAGVIVVCEGYSTGASIHEATGAAVAVAFNTSNLKTAADALAGKFPDCEIVIAADDDRDVVKPVVNPGIHYAKLTGRRYIVPVFSDPTCRTDFNDLAVAEGLSAVADQFRAFLETSAQAEVIPIDAAAKRKALAVEIEQTDDFEELTIELVQKVQSSSLSRAAEEFLLKAIARKTNVSKSALLGNAVPDEQPDTDPAEDQSKIVAELNDKHAVVTIGGKVRILNKEFDPMLKRNMVTYSGRQDFELRYCNRRTQRAGDEMDIGKFWLEHRKRRQYEAVVFSPGEDVPGYFNLFQGWGVKPKPGDCSLFLEFIEQIICDGNTEVYEYVLRWLAHLFQRPRELPGTAIVLRGGQGIGKTVFAKSIGYLVGAHYLTLNSMAQVTGRFSGHLADALLVFADEAIWGGDRSSSGALKQMIDGAMTPIEGKGTDIIQMPNFKRLIAASNERWVVPRDFDDRRFLILDVSEEKKKNEQYFGPVVASLQNGGYSALLHYLLNEDIGGWSPRTLPDCARSFGWDMKIQSAPTPVQWWFECLEKGFVKDHWPDIDEDVPKKVVHSAYLDWCQTMKINHPIGIAAFAKELVKYGITAHKPRFKDGRVPSFKIKSLEESQKIFSKVVGTPEKYWDGEES